MDCGVSSSDYHISGIELYVSAVFPNIKKLVVFAFPLHQAVQGGTMMNEIWNVPIRITRIKVMTDYVVLSYEVIEKPYKLCDTELRTWREAEHER